MIVRKDDKIYYSNSSDSRVDKFHTTLPPKGYHNFIFYPNSKDQKELFLGFPSMPPSDLFSNDNYLMCDGDKIQVERELDELRFEGFDTIRMLESGRLTAPNFIVRKLVFPHSLLTATLEGKPYNCHGSTVTCMDFSQCFSLAECPVGFVTKWINVKEIWLPNYYPTFTILECAISDLPALERIIFPWDVVLKGSALVNLGKDSEEGVDLPFFSVTGDFDYTAPISDCKINRMLIADEILLKHAGESYFCEKCEIEELIITPTSLVNELSSGYMFRDCIIKKITIVSTNSSDPSHKDYFEDIIRRTSDTPTTNITLNIETKRTIREIYDDLMKRS